MNDQRNYLSVKLTIQRFVSVLAATFFIILLPDLSYGQGPTGEYAAGISCLNLTETEMAVSIDFYDANGALVTSFSNGGLEANSTWLLFTPNIPGTPDSFLTSAVVKSREGIACSVNAQTNSGTTRVGTSQGQSEDDVGPKLFATQIVNDLGGFNSYVAVQNVGTIPTNVRAIYYDSAGISQFNTIVSIPAKASNIFYQSETGLGPDFIGSATFESVDEETPLSGTVAIYKTGGGAANAQFLSFNTFTKGASKVFAPRLSKNLSNVGYTSGWACQNLGSSPIDMKMTITMEKPPVNGETETLSAILTKTAVGVGQSWGGYMGNVGNATLDAIEVGKGNAVIEASGGGEIACTFNEDNRTDFAGQGSTYNGIPNGQQSKTIFFPQIVALGAESFRGGFQYANTTETATTCTHTYTNSRIPGHTEVVTDIKLDPNSSKSIFAETELKEHNTDFNGSVMVTCGEDIVGIYNLSIQGPAASGDPFATNNGINR